MCGQRSDRLLLRCVPVRDRTAWVCSSTRARTAARSIRTQRPTPRCRGRDCSGAAGTDTRRAHLRSPEPQSHGVAPRVAPTRPSPGECGGRVSPALAFVRARTFLVAIPRVAVTSVVIGSPFVRQTKDVVFACRRTNRCATRHRLSQARTSRTRTSSRSWHS